MVEEKMKKAVWLARRWKEELEELADMHPRVVKKMEKSLKKWAGTDNIDKALEKLAEELIERQKKRPQLQSAKIAITYTLYRFNHYGSMVKFYDNGEVFYKQKNTIEGYGFVIYNGEEVA